MTEYPFYFENGQFFCENINIDELFNSFKETTQEIKIGENTFQVDVPSTPSFVYSSAAIKRNAFNYIKAMTNANIKGCLGYAVKANGNHSILQTLKENGVDMLVTVSGNEILAGLKAGFQPSNIILNGNGKQDWEIKLAIQLGVILNVDSIFDGENIVSIHKKHCPSAKVKVLLRIRPSVKVHQKNSVVHPYVNTAEASKFGFDLKDLDKVLEILEEDEEIKVHGIHCHLGSCIYDPQVYRCMGEIMGQMATELKNRGYSIEILDVGGGIGINYHSQIPGVNFICKENSQQLNVNTEESLNSSDELQMPTSISPFMETISEFLPKDLTIVVEPGRSLIANTGVLVCKMLGVKDAEQKRFIVVDGSMAEIIRPCLYGSHHQIYPTRITDGVPWRKCDVVGPICETADFLGIDMLVQEQSKYFVVMDAGAYCSSMSSNYNMRPRPAEILVEGESFKFIRRRDTFDDLTFKTAN